LVTEHDERKERTMRPLLILTGACAAGALIFASAGLADKPIAQTLNPPPPPYETCKAVGDGTICQGTVTFSYAPVDTAAVFGVPLVCGSGPSAFDIFDSVITGDSLARRFYNADGNLVRRMRVDHVSSGEYSNPLTGATVPYTMLNTLDDVLATPGDLGSATETITGQWIFRPAQGAPVFVNAGRLVFAPDFTLEFRSGPQEFMDLFVNGDTSVLGPLCTALGA
jgi:hypothetical protein